MKTIKSIFTSSAFWFLFVMPTVAIWSIVYFHDPVHRYVGTVIKVSSWNGNATLKTKTNIRKRIN
jgi:hypothetical protein